MDTSITIILSSLVIVSYYLTFKDEKQNYSTSRFWLGLSKNNIKALIVLQLIALVGAIIFFTWFSGLWGDPPTEGLFVYNDGKVAKYLIWMFLVSSVFWSYFAKKSLSTNETLWVFLTVLVLCIAALSVVGLVAGAFENKDTPVLALVGILELAGVVVLTDAIGWNSLLISKHLYT